MQYEGPPLKRELNITIALKFHLWHQTFVGTLAVNMLLIVSLYARKVVRQAGQILYASSPQTCSKPRPNFTIMNISELPSFHEHKRGTFFESIIFIETITTAVDCNPSVWEMLVPSHGAFELLTTRRRLLLTTLLRQ